MTAVSKRKASRKVPYRGYAAGIVSQIMAADSALPGVQLGKFCVEYEVPVEHVAKVFGVSRPTVYKWFTGKYQPRRQVHLDLMREWIARRPS